MIFVVFVSSFSFFFVVQGRVHISSTGELVQESFRERGHRVSYICLDMIAFLVRTSNVVGFPGLVRLCTGPAFARCEH